MELVINEMDKLISLVRSYRVRDACDLPIYSLEAGYAAQGETLQLLLRAKSHLEEARRAFTAQEG